MAPGIFVSGLKDALASLCRAQMVGYLFPEDLAKSFDTWIFVSPLTRQEALRIISSDAAPTSRG
jgi:hypothetical protein